MAELISNGERMLDVRRKLNAALRPYASRAEFEAAFVPAAVTLVNVIVGASIYQVVRDDTVSGEDEWNDAAGGKWRALVINTVAAADLEAIRDEAEAAQAAAEAARDDAAAERAAAETAATTLGAAAYATASALPPEPDDGARGYVYADPVQANNGLWFWNGTAWVQDALNPAPLASPTFTGVPAAPTATPGTNTTQLATTAFVQQGLNTRADAAAFQQFVARVLAALPSLAYRVVPYTNDPRKGAIQIVADEIRYPPLWVSKPDDQSAIDPGEEGPWFVNPAPAEYFALTFPTIDDPLGTVRTYFVDMAASPRVVASEVGINVSYSADRLILGVAHRGQYVNMADLAVTFALLATESDPVIMFDRPTIRAEAMQLALATLPVPDESTGAPWVTAAAGPIQIGGPMQSQVLVLQAAGVQADCSYMMTGTDAVINFVAGGTVFAGHGRKFAGQSGMHTATVPAGGIVRVSRISANATFGTVVEGIGGTSLTYSGGVEPVHGVSIALAGQSQLELGYSRGLPGSFARATRNSVWMPALDVDAFWIEGATGGSSILVASNNWWNIGGTEGPALTTWKTSVSAAMSAGQPVPECIMWMQGEGDSGVLQIGTYTNAVYKDAIKSVWAAMRTFLTGLGAVDPQILVVQLGAWDFDGDAYPTGASAVRWAYQKAIDEVAYAHFAADSYDIPRPWGDVHLGGMGHYHLAHRLARAYGNVIHGQANSLGPQITLATWRSAADFRAAVVGLPSGLHLPRGDMGDVASGPYPWGLQILSGANMTTDVPIIRGILDRVSNTITLETNTNLTGCRVAVPAGFATDQRAGHLIRDMQAHGRLMGLPLRSGLSAPLAAP